MGPYDDLTLQEKRIKIARRVGTHEISTTPLGKATFNSLIAWFTGSLPTEPALLHTDIAPSLAQLKRDVATIAGLNDYIDETTEHTHRPLRTGELTVVLEQMDARGDSRPWMD